MIIMNTNLLCILEVFDTNISKLHVMLKKSPEPYKQKYYFQLIDLLKYNNENVNLWQTSLRKKFSSQLKKLKNSKKIPGVVGK